MFGKSESALLGCVRMRAGRSVPRAKKIEMMAEACSFVNFEFEEMTSKYPLM